MSGEYEEVSYTLDVEDPPWIKNSGYRFDADSQTFHFWFDVYWYDPRSWLWAIRMVWTTKSWPKFGRRDG